MTHPTQAVILLSRGGYSQAPRKQLHQMVTSLQADRPDLLISGAMVDKGQPSLPEALQQCAETNVQRITVLPIFLPGDDNLQRWLGKVMARWSNHWTGQPIQLCLANSLGDYSALPIAIAEVLKIITPYIEDVTETPPDNWQNDPPGWSKIPNHTHHVFVCQGPRCTALGAGMLATHLQQKLKAHQSTRDDRVLVAQSGCLYPCSLGPMMVVYPEGVWYGNLTTEAIDQIVEDHFVSGQPVKKYVANLDRES